MNKLKHTGIKISDYPSSISNVKDFPHKLEYNHYFITYAPTYFGTSTINKNYKIPLEMLRQDQKFYIGLNNAKGDWQNLLNFWSGYWFNEDKTESYVTPWTHEERGSADFIKNKYGLEDDEDKIDRIFFIKDAPIPLEEEHEDPNPQSNKFVNKKYIDDRFNGIRKISVTGETLAIRPYSCVYEFENTPTVINIVDTETLQDGRTVAECIDGNILSFIIKFNVGDSDILAIKANGKHNIKWAYPTEFQDIVKTAKENNNSDVWLQCYVGYTEDGLSIRCSSALHPMPGSHESPKVTDKVTDGDTKIPTSDAVYDFVKEEIKPKLEEVVAGDFIEVNNKNEVVVKTSSSIINDSTTVPTTKATMDFVDEQKIWDLNKFVYDCIRKSKDSSKYEWVKEYILNSSNIYIDTEFETKDEWIEYVKAGNDPYNPLIFINDMYDVSTSNNSESSTGYSKIGEFVKKMFLQLDEDAGKEWMSDDSFSKKYLKTGLAIKYITYLSIDGNNTDLPRPTDFSTIANLNSDFVYPSYTISIYTSPNFSDLNDASQVSFEKPVLDYRNFSFDSLTKNKNWNYLISEQEMKITRNFLKNLIKDSTDEIIINLLSKTWNDSKHVVNTSPTYGDTVGAIKLSKQYFTAGKIESIKIPYDYVANVSQYSWSNNTPIYLIITVHLSDGNTQSFISSNSDVYNEELNYSFNFTNCVIPEDYDHVIINASSINSIEERDYQDFRVIPVRDKNIADKKKSIITIDDNSCYFYWFNNTVQTSGTNRLASIETIKIVQPTESIIDDDPRDNNTFPTTSAIKDFVETQSLEITEQWHENNGYEHYESFEPRNAVTQADVTQTNGSVPSVNCCGFTFRTPQMMKLSTLHLYGNNGNSEYHNTWLKIIDKDKGHVLGVASLEKSWHSETSGNWRFESQPILSKDKTYYVLFSGNPDSNDKSTKTLNVFVTYKFINGSERVYPNTNKKDLDDCSLKLGESFLIPGNFTRQYFTVPSPTSEQLQSISTEIIGNRTDLFDTLAITPFGKWYITEAFNDLVEESHRVYFQHKDETFNIVDDLINEKLNQITFVKNFSESNSGNNDYITEAFNDLVEESHRVYFQLKDETFNTINEKLNQITFVKNFSETNSGSNDYVQQFDISKLHFTDLNPNVTNFPLKSLTLINDGTISASNHTSATEYLILQVLDDSKNVISATCSTNKSKVKADGNEGYVFYFDNFVIPENYSAVRGFMSANKLSDEDAKSATFVNSLEMRIKTSTDEPDDLCAVYWPAAQAKKMILFNAEYECQKYVSYDKYKELLNRVSQLESIINQFTTQ